MRLPEGVQLSARVKSFAPGVTKNGHLQVVLTWMFTSNEYRGQLIEHSVIFSATGDTKISFETLEKAGWDGQSFEDLNGLGTVEALLTLKEDTWEYNGKTYSALKVHRVHRAGEGGAGFGAGIDKESFANRLRAMKGLPPAPTFQRFTPGAAADDGDDDDGYGGDEGGSDNSNADVDEVAAGPGDDIPF